MKFEGILEQASLKEVEIELRLDFWLLFLFQTLNCQDESWLKAL